MTLLVHAASALATPDFLVASLGPAAGLLAGALPRRALRRAPSSRRRALGIRVVGLLCLALGSVTLLAAVPLLALDPVGSAGFGAGQLLGLAGGAGLSAGTSLYRASARANRRSTAPLCGRTETI